MTDPNRAKGITDDINWCCADWWSKSDFVLNELNVQSVVTAPAHDEMIALTAQGSYTVKGFAYSGQTCTLMSCYNSKTIPQL